MTDTWSIYDQPEDGIEVKEQDFDELTHASREAARVFYEAQQQAKQMRKIRKGDTVKVKGMPGHVEVKGVVTIDGEEFILVPVNAAGSVRPLGFSRDEIELVS